jgi:hypothetical protein
MKKLITLTLLLVIFTAVCWAEQHVLSVDAEGRTVVADGDSGAVPVPPKHEHNGEEVLVWDNGELNGYWMDTYDRGVDFTAPFDCHVITGLVYLYEESITVWPFRFAIYEDNGGVPGIEMGGVYTAGGSEGWNEVDLIPARVMLAEGKLFYGVVLKSANEQPYFCSDTADPAHGYYYNDGTEWLFSELSNLMLRIVVDDDVNAPYTCNPNPEPGDSGVGGDTSISFEIKDTGHDVVLDTISVVVEGRDVTDECIFSEIVTGGYGVVYKPEKDFPAGTVEVYWSGEDELGNWGEDMWSFTVEDSFSNIEETSWGVIKEVF